MPAEVTVKVTQDQAARLALGTAQFGLSYGISHDGGPVPAGDAEAILAAARAAGISLLDTAAAYGDSESVLGQISRVSGQFDIVTKTLPIRSAELTEQDLTAIDTGFHRSLKRLKRERVAALLVHDAGDLLARNGDRLWRMLEKYRSGGLVGRIGVSVYEADQINAVLARFPIELVQLPINVFDQRLVANGSLMRLAERGIEVHARSLLLQGLLLMTETAVTARLPAALSAVRLWRTACTNAGVTPLAAALGFGLARPEIRRLVLGVHSTQHLAECLAAMREASDSNLRQMDWPTLGCNDSEVIDPRRWSGTTINVPSQVHQSGQAS